MSRIERRVLAAAMAGALAMLGVVGYVRENPDPVPAARAVPVIVDSHYRVTAWSDSGAEPVVRQGNWTPPQAAADSAPAGHRS